MDTAYKVVERTLDPITFLSYPMKGRLPIEEVGRLSYLTVVERRYYTEHYYDIFKRKAYILGQIEEKYPLSPGIFVIHSLTTIRNFLSSLTRKKDGVRPEQLAVLLCEVFGNRTIPTKIGHPVTLAGHYPVGYPQKYVGVCYDSIRPLKEIQITGGS